MTYRATGGRTPRDLEEQRPALMRRRRELWSYSPTDRRVRVARETIARWCRTKGWTVRDVRHVQPACYVVGYIASSALLVAAPWMDSEPQTRDRDRLCPLTVVYRFDPELHAGDWCALAYVQHGGCGEHVAVGYPQVRPYVLTLSKTRHVARVPRETVKEHAPRTPKSGPRATATPRPSTRNARKDA